MAVGLSDTLWSITDLAEMIDATPPNPDRVVRTRADKRKPKGTEMGRQVAVVLYVVAMAAVIVSADLVFFRNQFWQRLIANIGIVLVFAAFYLRFLRHP